MKLESLRASIRNHFFIQLANALFVLSGLLIHIYLSRGGLEFSDYGTFNLLLSILTALSLVFTTGFPLFAVKRIAGSDISINEFFAVTLIDLALCGIVIASLCFFSGTLGAVLFSDQTLNSYLPLIALILPCYLVYSFVLSFVNGRKEYKKQACFIIFHSIIKIVGALAFSYLWGLSGALTAYGLPGMVITVIALLRFGRKEEISIREISKHFRLQISGSDLWFFIVPATAYAFLNGAVLSKDLLIVEHFLSDEELATYSVIVVFARVSVHSIVALGTVFFPAYASLPSISEARGFFFKHLALELFAGCGILAAYALSGKFVLTLVYGTKFGEHTTVLILATASGISYALQTLICVKLQAVGRQFVSVLGVGAALLILQFAGSYAVKEFGLIGASCNILFATFPVFLVLASYFYLCMISDRHSREQKP